MIRGVLGALLFVVASVASANEPVHVVKFVSVDCSVCRASENLDAPIRSAVEGQGGRFIVAPLPRGNNEARERFYYALRELGPEIETQVRRSLYRGAQDLGYPLSDAPQTLDWLQNDLASSAIDWKRFLDAVNGGETAAAVERAVQLAVRAGLQVVPAYVLVQNNKILTTLDPKSVQGGELPALREAVLEALRNLNTTP
jgi:protein-disulfide isomerase